MDISFVKTPRHSRSGRSLNRIPLAFKPLERMPAGSAKPKGWLKEQLKLSAQGMTGRLKETSRFLGEDNGWLRTENRGWEEQAYWFRGFYSLAVITGDQDLNDEKDRWIEAILSSQDEDGYFGPRQLKRVVFNRDRYFVDLFPHMVMIYPLIRHFEHTADDRIISCLLRFFKFCDQIPPESFISTCAKNRDLKIAEDSWYEPWLGFIQHNRSAEMVSHIYWLFNKTGEDWLLMLADRFYKETKGPDNEWLDVHNVNFAQRFRYPGIYYQQSREKRHLEESEYWYRQHMSTWGQQAGGAFAGDELVRSGYQDPRQGIETCGIVEFANSFNMLASVSGDPVYADRCEEIMFNHFPASLTPEYKGVRYVNASNQPILNGTFNHHYRNDMSRTEKNKFDGVPFVVYTPWGHRCCQHNSGMGWPYFAENLCLKTADGGIATWLYSSAAIKTEAGGREVTISEETSYPFTGTVTLTIDCGGAADFPFYVRVPGWCRDYTLQINGEPLFESAGATGGFLKCRRTWNSGDCITLSMEMPCRIKRWPRNGSATILRGPLAFSVKIEEHWQRWIGEDKNQNYDFRRTYEVYEDMVKGTDEWPNYEVFPRSPWNYALILGEDVKEFCKVILRDDIPDQPWTPDSVPLEIKVKARKLLEWSMEGEFTPEVPKSPVFSQEPDEEITLIPLGAARLRMACLPVIGNE